MSTWNHVGGGRIADSTGKHIGQFIGDFKDRDHLICAVNEIESLRAENEALKQQVEQGKRDAVPEGIRKDAERYRQVRLLALLQKEVETYDEFDKHTDKFIADELPTTDAAIAAAQKQEK